MGADIRADVPGPKQGRLGVSIAGFLVTLAVLLLFLFVVLEFVDRWTRIPAPAPPPPGLRTSLDSAARALTRDLETAASGRLPATEGIRPAGDNTPTGEAFFDFRGETFVVRPGTDRLGIRGVLRSPVLILEPADRATGLPFSASPEAGGSGAIQAQPATARVKIYAQSPAQARADPSLAAVLARLGSRPLVGPRKRFFVAGSGTGTWAAARVLSFLDRTTGAKEGCPPAQDGCHIEVALDFTDADAIRMNPNEDPDAFRRLGALSWGGLLDEVSYFVAQGARGAPPDYFSVNDPPSLAFPHPFLAMAESVGSDRWDVVRVAEDIENLQVAWEIATPTGVEWRADRPGASPVLLTELSSSTLRLMAVRIALVAKAAQRRLASKGTENPQEALPFNSPPPSRYTAPVGWAANPREKIAFDRETRYLMIRLRGGTR
jgi:hypothetical protein